MPLSSRIYGARIDDSLTACLTDLQITELPLHVMVGRPSSRQSRGNIISHLYEQALPEGSLCRISPDVYVASPELTLCQLSTSVSFVDLIELCLEFCSGYVLNPEDAERGFDDRPALTTSSRLAAYVARYEGRRGASLMKRALRYVIDNSASPMETHVLMLLCLPSKLGGYELPMPRHNVSIPVSDRAKSHTGRTHLLCDLYWEEFHLDVECDSTLYHTSKEQLGIDSDRRIILDAMKYKYVGITGAQLEDARRLLDAVQAIRRAMGLRLRDTPDHIAARREALRVYLTTRPDKRQPLRFH